MYTNIPTDYALKSISEYLRNNEYSFEYHAETLISALEIVTKNNIIKFGDVYKKQISGTAIGKPPAPPWAKIYEGIHEDEYIPQWTNYVKLIRRFIDNGCAIWDPPAEASDEEFNGKYDEFKAVVNDNKGLTWEFTELSNSVNFLDLTLTIMPDDHIKTKLFEKPMALHLYIPPHSMHPPGVLTSHIFGSILRMFRLNSDEDETVSDVLCLYHNLTKRGHKEETLKPLFLKAIANARKFMPKSDL